MPSLSRRGDRVARTGRQAQQGAATLIVVMILFFVISMVAAYTNRNLIFEQKTASNQQRSSRALEAADAGLEWALTLLNTGRLTASCQTSTSVADTDFRQRYLVIDPPSGNITPRKWNDGTADRDLYPTCVYNGTSWVCDCPNASAPTVAAPAGTDVYPAFRVRFRRVCTVSTASDSACTTPIQPGIVHIDVNGCTTLDDNCLRFHDEATPGAAVANEGRATVHVVAALKASLPTAPTAALTARDRVDINVGSVGFNVVNGHVKGSGITILAGDTVVVPSDALQGPAGTPGSRTLVENDAVLNALTSDRMFANTFGLGRNSYRDQPSAIVVDCTGGCNATTVRTKVSLNPGRPLWLAGDVDFDSGGDVGSAAEPVLLNVTGSVTFSGPVTVYGLVYSQANTWTIAGSGSIVGAAIAERRFEGTATTTSIVYDRDVLTRLRTLTGSFVRVPGTWKDFES